MASMLEKDKELITKACRGSSKELMHLGVRAYWGYDTITGAATTEDALLAIDAAGVCDKGACAEETGDFYRFELQEEKSEAFYAYSVLHDLDKAVEGDGSAQMNLAKKYAYGRGVDQSDENACFWTLAAAANAEEEAVVMEQNFWQTPGILPVSEEMARRERKPGRKTGAEVDAIRKALIEKEAANAYKEASAQSKNLTKQYAFSDLSKTAKARMINPVLDLIIKILASGTILYVIVSALVFLVNFFAGYHETGILRYVTDAYGALLGIPIKTLLVIMTDYKYAEITTQIMCEWFCFNGKLIVGAFAFVFSGVAAAAWFAICGGIYFIVWTIFATLYRQGIKITPMDNGEEPQWAAKSCDDAAYNQWMAQTPELKKYEAFELMAICAIADAFEIGIADACARFDAMGIANETPTMLIQPTYQHISKYDKYVFTVNSDMGLYFVMRRGLQIRYLACPLPNLDAKSDLMAAYRTYRKGKNYKEAESQFQRVIDSQSASKEERAWAKYFLSQLCFNEFLYDYDVVSDYKKSDEATIARGKQLREEAAAECIFANDSVEAVLARAWAFEADAIYMVAHLLDVPELSKYLNVIAEEKSRRHVCGAPVDREKWEDHETKTLCVELNTLTKNLDEAIEKFNKSRQGKSTCEEFEKELKKYRSQLESMMKKGYMKAGRVHKLLSEIYDQVSARILEFIQEQQYEDRLREAREAEISRRMAQFEDDADARERSINAFAFGDAYTDFDRHLLGQMSDKNYYASDYSRHLAREKYRAEVEAEYDRQHTYDDD